MKDDFLSMRRWFLLLFVFLCGIGGGIFAVQAAYGADVKVAAIRLGSNADNHLRLVLDISKRVDYKAFTLAAPYRLVLDLPETTWPKGVPKSAYPKLVSGIRYGLFAPSHSRLVLDMTGAINITESFIIAPSSGFGHRLVVDLKRVEAAQFKRARPVKSKPPRKQVVRRIPQDWRPLRRPRDNKPVIVLDAGHGGVDPGAQGHHVQEKEVVFKYTKELAAQLKKSKKYHVYLTRERDIYIPLRKRVAIARQRKADLFISIHADAIGRKNVRGLSIYTLSEHASDAEAAALARNENQSDIIAGIDFGEQPPEVANILLDLAQRETKNLSVHFANLMIEEADNATRILDRPHRSAGFRVLKAPDVPSVLVELGFLTNKSDESLLMSSRWRRKVARAMSEAIDAYFTPERRAGL